MSFIYPFFSLLAQESIGDVSDGGIYQAWVDAPVQLDTAKTMTKLWEFSHEVSLIGFEIWTSKTMLSSIS